MDGLGCPSWDACSSETTGILAKLYSESHGPNRELPSDAKYPGYVSFLAECALNRAPPPKGSVCLQDLFFATSSSPRIIYLRLHLGSLESRSVQVSVGPVIPTWF